MRSGPDQGNTQRIIISHYENNYGGAVKRLNLSIMQPKLPGRRVHEGDQLAGGYDGPRL